MTHTYIWPNSLLAPDQLDPPRRKAMAVPDSISGSPAQIVL